ncbi:MAG: hypothetical protein HOD60_02205 [Candidatus Nitrosopelagicus sp.]|nr:hypothetical protein [Candidatus Nitrosopelagicus sp.]
MKTNWLPYTEARSFVHKLKFKTVTQWLIYSKSGKRPFNIPSSPRRTYKKEWKGMSDWLGTEIIQTQKRVYRKYDDARKFVHKLELINRDAWIEYCKLGNKPDDIPNNPWNTYKNSGWKGMGDWLGTGTLATRDIEFWPFKKARIFVHKLELTGSEDWKKYCKSGNKPEKIPSAPWNTYKKEWKSIGDWLGTGTIASQKRKYLTYDNAKKFVHKLHLSGSTAWRKYVKSGKLPDNIPSNPNNTYQKQGTWISWGDFLGTNNISVTIKSKSFLSPKKAKPVLKKLFKEYDIKNLSDWKKFAKTHGKLLEELRIPSYLLTTYSKKNVIKWEKQK